MWKYNKYCDTGEYNYDLGKAKISLKDTKDTI